jgi:hypothetical protein
MGKRPYCVLFRRLGRAHSWYGCFGEKIKLLSLLRNKQYLVPWAEIKFSLRILEQITITEQILTVMISTSVL